MTVGATLRIYLSGSIQKGDRDLRSSDHFWSADDEEHILAQIEHRCVDLLNPSKTGIARADYLRNYGCDLYLLSISDFVYVDARTKKGIGVGAEMMFAQIRQIPVITICPRNSYYHRDTVLNVFGEDLVDWIHPFVFGLSNAIVETLDDAVQLTNSVLRGETDNLRRVTTDEAITYYTKYNRNP